MVADLGCGIGGCGGGVSDLKEEEEEGDGGVDIGIGDEVKEEVWGEWWPPPPAMGSHLTRS